MRPSIALPAVYLCRDIVDFRKGNVAPLSWNHLICTSKRPDWVTELAVFSYVQKFESWRAHHPHKIHGVIASGTRKP
jgi:hypothetical protein